MNGNRFLLDTNAIIAATSVANNASLITADKGFNKVKEIKVIGL